MPRLPSAQDVPTVGSPRDPGVRNIRRIGETGEDVPTGMAELSQGLRVAGTQIIAEQERRAAQERRLAAAQARIDERKRGVIRDRGDLAFAERVSQTETELRSGGANLADETLIQATVQELDQYRQEVLDSAGGDEKLALRLHRRMIEATDRLGALNAAAIQQQDDASWQRRVNAVATAAGNDPGSLATAVAQLEDEIDFLGYGPVKREAKRLEGMEAIGTSIVGSFLAQGDANAAERALAATELREFLPPSKRNELRSRIAAAKRVRTEATGRVLSEEERTTLFPSIPPGSVVQVKEQNGRISDVVVRFKPPEATSVEMSAREEKAASFAAMFQRQGMDAARAVDLGAKLAEGAARVDINESTGKVVLIDEVKAMIGDPDAVTELSIQPTEEVDRVEIEPQDTLFSLAGDATGLQSAFRAMTARIPLTSLLPEEGLAINARTIFNTFQNDLARGLVVNPRFPVGEVERVIESLDVSPRLLDNEAAMQARLIAVDRYLRIRLAQFERDTADTSLPEGLRSAQAENASAMRNAIDRIGAPQRMDFSKLDVTAIEAMDVPNLRWVINQMTIEELESLPEEVRAEMRAVMGGRR